MMKPKIVFIVLAVLLGANVYSQPNYQPTEENLKNREWFQNAKFGLFIHWGVYSILGDGEGAMNSQQIPIRQYERLATFFNPTQFDPAEWVSMVKKAGIKYITITSKHHDGFAMFDSKISDYDIVDRTPYGKDVLQMLKDECDKQGIKLFFYYSQLDWHHPDYFPRGFTGQKYTGRPESGDWNKYIDYMNTQLTELLTNYGKVGGIWFDGMWENEQVDWQLNKTYELIHKLQPDVLIGDNHHHEVIAGEDFQTFERDLPGENTHKYCGTSSIPISDLPLEVCETMNNSWGFNINDGSYVSSKQLIQLMVRVAGYGSNLLLNTGPMPNGKIQQENIDTLMVMGKWLEKYGETIYSTRKGPIRPQDWGVTTLAQDGKIYIHILNIEGEELLIPSLPGKIKSAKYFDGGEKVAFKETQLGLQLIIPKSKTDEIDTILEIELKK
ncbi:MAG: alpha-L-fucosidase [Mangrovibacterium sp.]